MDETITLTAQEFEDLLTTGNKAAFFLARGDIDVAKKYVDSLTLLIYRKLTEYAEHQAEIMNTATGEHVEPFKFTRFCCSDT